MFPDRIGCNQCTCLANHHVACTSRDCPLPMTCQHGSSVYRQGDTFETGGSCSLCICGHNGAIACRTKRHCMVNCSYKQLSYGHGGTFFDRQDCKLCQCYNGQLSCVDSRPTMPTFRCEKGPVKCKYGRREYKPEETFMAKDGCTFCLCGKEGQLACTRHMCRPTTREEEARTCRAGNISLNIGETLLSSENTSATPGWNETCTLCECHRGGELRCSMDTTQCFAKLNYGICRYSNKIIAKAGPFLDVKTQRDCRHCLCGPTGFVSCSARVTMCPLSLATCELRGRFYGLNDIFFELSKDTDEIGPEETFDSKEVDLTAPLILGNERSIVTHSARRRASGPQHPAGGPQHPAGGPQHPAGGPQHPAGGPQHPAGGPQHPAGGPQRPAGGPQHPAGGPQHPAGGPQHPAGGPERPAGGPERPAGGPQHPAEGPQRPAGGPERPAGGPERPAGGPQHPAGGPRYAYRSCRKCICRQDGVLACVQSRCRTAVCVFEGKPYYSGANFTDENGCKSCLCTDSGTLHCKQRPCLKQVVQLRFGSSCTSNRSTNEPEEYFIIRKRHGCLACWCATWGRVQCRHTGCKSSAVRTNGSCYYVFFSFFLGTFRTCKARSLG